MDRMNFNSYDHFHYYNQTYQGEGQHTCQPETGQTSGGVAASGTSWNYPGQSYQDFNVQAQIPFSPGPDWESALRTPQPMAMEDLIHGQIHQQDGQYSFQPEIGQTSTEVPASGPWWSQPTPGQLQPYQDFTIPVQVPPSLGSDLEYIQHPQSMVLEDAIQNDTSLVSSNPQPAVAPRRRKAPIRGLPPAKDRFLAGLEAFARGVDLRDCSSSLKFSNYIKDDGSMTSTKGESLHNQLTDAERMLLRQAIIARHGAKDIKLPVQERFLAGLDKYAQGAKLVDCSATLKFGHYVTDDGHLSGSGRVLRDSLSEEDQDRVNQALLSRREFCLRRTMENAPVEERFLAGLDNYAQDVPVVYCSTAIDFGGYVTDKGTLLKRGRELLNRLSAQNQERVNQALISRQDCYSKRAKGIGPVEGRFLASLDNYANGLKLSECAEDIPLRNYVSEDGNLHKEGESLRARLSPMDQDRVNRALAIRRRKAAEQISGDIPNFLTALEPYANGLDLQVCGKQSGLNKKAERYLTPEGGLTPKGQLLVENLSRTQQNYMLYCIQQRQQRTQVQESPWQRPEVPASIPEMGGMDPIAMSPSMQQTETMVDPMQTEAMWASVWQMTGQAMPGTWEMPSELAEPPIPSYNSEAFGAAFQHQYGSYADQYPGRGV
jgi:hypothetical protein